MATREEIATALGSRRCRECGRALSEPEHVSNYCPSCSVFLIGKYIEEQEIILREALVQAIKNSLWRLEKK